MSRIIDLNSDMGESFGFYKYGADEELMPLISSANLACGFHAGDPHVIRKSVALAAQYRVRVGAHIGLPDKLGFGRRDINVTPEEVYDFTLYQLGALDGFLKAENLSMSHIKPHGALYMKCAEQGEIGEAMVKAVLAFNPELDIYTLPNSHLEELALSADLNVVREYFADRPYHNHYVQMFGWTLEQIGQPVEMAERALTELYEVPLGTICVHSDTPRSPEIMKAVREILIRNGWTIGWAEKRVFKI